MKDRKVILASASPRRRELLEQIGFQPEVIPSEIEESGVSGKPRELVMELSARKAEAVSARAPEGVLVIGADTVVSADGEILGKPESHEDAARMIRRIQGRRHQVYTGVTLIYKEEGRSRKVTFAEETEVAVYPMTEDEIVGYAKTREPMDKAGAYAIQGAFAAYIEGIHGDYANVVGLPVGRVYQEWKRLMKGMEEEERDQADSE